MPIKSYGGKTVGGSARPPPSPVTEELSFALDFVFWTKHVESRHWVLCEEVNDLRDRNQDK